MHIKPSFSTESINESASIPVRKSCLKKFINCRYVFDMASDVSGRKPFSPKAESHVFVPLSLRHNKIQAMLKVISPHQYAKR
jgi:hypothetical protein